MRKIIFALSAAALTVPAATIPTDAAQAQYKTWRGKDGRIYCRRPNGTTGLIVGGAAGALVGNAVGGNTLGTVVGAAGGALLGREVQRSRAKRRCVARR
ncbi:MAG: glycine zipper 2TM domain-containing protein [Proteobacteria bacterium]|nr:glycine zipper 2TM domain-containing protein [Pseudomonadota bacterium]